MVSKYIGKVYEGRWRVERKEKRVSPKGQTYSIFFLQNIYNNTEIGIRDVQLSKIESGKSSVSSVISSRAGGRKWKW